MQMTVKRVVATEVVVPAHPGAINSLSLGNFLGHEWDQMPICLLEIEFSDGITGLGEVGRGTALQELDSWLRDLPGASVTGCRLDGLPERWKPQGRWGGVIEEEHSPAPWSSPSPLYGAVEMALLDRLGKLAGERAAEMLGGAVRELIPVDYWCGRKTPEDLKRTAAAARDRGFRGIKMKSRRGDPVMEQVRALRLEGGDDFGVTIDPMYQWFSPHDSLHVIQRLQEFGGGIRIEDPFPEEMPEYWRRARSVSSVPLIWHARGLASLRRALQEGCCDGFNASGGPREFLTAAHAIEVEGYSCWRGSALELGIAQAAGLHAAAAARACVWASDFQSGLIREHTLVTWDWPYAEGHLSLPEGSGLGVELDRDAVARYRTAAAEYRA